MTIAGITRPESREDGVDFMSFSVCSYVLETHFDENSLAVGAFAAARKGIFVACSAGNDGPHGFTVLNGPSLDHNHSRRGQLIKIMLTATRKSYIQKTCWSLGFLYTLARGIE